MNTLVSVEELAERLPFEMDEDDKREAQGALSDLSDDARAYGLSAWETPELTPHSVRNLIVRAAARHMKNYEGYTFSRAGDETVQWTDRGESAGTATFTADEKAMLRSMTGRTSFGSMGFTAWGASKAAGMTGYVPHADGRKSVPYFANASDPW